MIDEKRLIKECEERLLVGTNVIKMIEEQPKILEWIPLEKKKPENDFVYRDFEEKLKKIMGTQVVIKNKNNNKGKIEIQYYSQAELERIYDLLKKVNE